MNKRRHPSRRGHTAVMPKPLKSTGPSTVKITAPAPDEGPPPGLVLGVDRLTVKAGTTDLVRDVTFGIRAGERVGLIGESGSGKSMTAMSLLGLLPEGVRASGVVRVEGVRTNLLWAKEKQLAGVRGKVASVVFQEPMTALNPTMRIGHQVAETMLLHGTKPNRQAARQAAVELLAKVQLPDPEQAARAYPHQLSGGQRQRVVLAIALANDPTLLICDEPTTALDVTVQKQMLDLITALSAEKGTALLFITHDLAVIAGVCDRVLVMYGGRVVEAGTVTEVFTKPKHPYTDGLIAASDLAVSGEDGRLRTIPGTVPGAGEFPAGCVFRNRCARATSECEREPRFDIVRPDHGAACWHQLEDESA